MASISSGNSSHKLSAIGIYVPLVGYISNQIVGAKLPSNRQVLRVFFYNIRVVNITTKESAALAIQEVSIFWRKSRIPTRKTDQCIDKLLKLYDEWQKIFTRTAGKEKERRDLFVEIMDDLFDIAHSEALEQIKNEKIRNFLMLQRQKGRPGFMVSVDPKLQHEEESALKHNAIYATKKKRTYEEMEQHLISSSTHQLATSNEDDLTSSSQSSDGGDSLQ